MRWLHLSTWELSQADEALSRAPSAGDALRGCRSLTTGALTRTFLAVDLDGRFLDAAIALALRLRGAPALSRARWASRESMHVTLRFFGPTDQAQLAGLRALVPELAQGALASAVRAAGVTGFPSASRARVIVLDLEDDGLLTSLAHRAEQAATLLGFAGETRPYRPHLTLARTRASAANVTSLEGEAAVLPVGRVTAIALYSSTTGPGGPVYTPLLRVPLPAAGP